MENLLSTAYILTYFQLPISAVNELKLYADKHGLD